MKAPTRPSPAATARGNDFLRPRAEATIRRWTPLRNLAGTMLGYIDIELPSGMVINGAKLMIGPNGKHWLAMPSQKQVDRDGAPVMKDGKQVYTQFVDFANKTFRDRFQQLVLDAMQRQHPAAFEGTAR
jgi:DNA-binding cell septation regulator SpoVG